MPKKSLFIIEKIVKYHKCPALVMSILTYSVPTAKQIFLSVFANFQVSLKNFKSINMIAM